MISNAVIPVFIALVIIFALIKRAAVFEEFTAGARENLPVALDILPTLIAMLTAVGMLKASGAMDIIANILSPVTNFLGFPKECLPLALMRPVSGSGALAVFESVISKTGPDSFAGRVASVILGSTETTFYTLAVYYGAVNIKKTRHSLASSLAADITGFIFSVLTVKLLF